MPAAVACWKWSVVRRLSPAASQQLLLCSLTSPSNYNDVYTEWHMNMDDTYSLGSHIFGVWSYQVSTCASLWMISCSWSLREVLLFPSGGQRFWKETKKSWRLVKPLIVLSNCQTYFTISLHLHTSNSNKSNVKIKRTAMFKPAHFVWNKAGRKYDLWDLNKKSRLSHTEHTHLSLSCAARLWQIISDLLRDVEASRLCSAILASSSILCSVRMMSSYPAFMVSNSFL